MFPSILTRYGQIIQESLISSIPSSQLELFSPLRYHMGWETPIGEHIQNPSNQGKSLRSALCLFASEALNGDWKQSIPAAVAIDLIHNFSLIHDDIQDGDITRRNMPTLWYVWGHNKAILAGNVMHALAYKTALTLVNKGISHKKAMDTSRLLAESSLSMIRGQCLDLNFEKVTEISVEQYLEMIRLKTGTLIACSLEIGALLASANHIQMRRFSEYGGHIGKLFQIRDDVLGIWGDSKKTGKATANDIRRKKKSLPIVYAFNKAKGQALISLNRIYQKESVTEIEVEEVLNILDQLEAQQFASSLVAHEAELAMKTIQNSNIQPWALIEAQELIEFLVLREY
ncbi:polyprenyl synthetase family protein [SAR202 cluster bacterium AC-409-J13_OGT_754m]|nr:polyprenyl synthetase family protein [SAR202 cluster bacterium AC-409-J13_OGT_754m]